MASFVKSETIVVPEAETSTTGYDPSKESDPTNPEYYKKQPIEPIKIIEAYGLTDLKKARWYLNRFIELQMRNTRKFKRIVVEYPSISLNPEYDGKPYFSIEYTENGREYTGYSTYDPKVLSDYLKEYFM